MNTKNIRTWGVVNSTTGEIEAVELTREHAREIKRFLQKKGLECKIAKLSFDKFVR